MGAPGSSVDPCPDPGPHPPRFHLGLPAFLFQPWGSPLPYPFPPLTLPSRGEGLEGCPPRLCIFIHDPGEGSLGSLAVGRRLSALPAER